MLFLYAIMFSCFWLCLQFLGKLTAGSSDSNLVSVVKSAGLGQGRLETKQMQFFLLQKWNLFELLFPFSPPPVELIMKQLSPQISAWARPAKFWAFWKITTWGTRMGLRGPSGKHSSLILEIKKKLRPQINFLTNRNPVGGHAGVGSSDA